MSYQVLARKWRPRRFDELVGQEHVVRALTHALDNDRLHHAFLFTGTRGIGKTTIARILAKCLNCEQGVRATPCGECNACRAIDEGRFVDLIEVDAASRTKVDDTRELLDNVQYAPTHARYKVYLVDEVHMLSRHSFNALLKTLEEPPPHVKFLLATTDPQRVPVTVLSRCLQFNLKRLEADAIAGQFRKILEAESIEAEDEAIRRIARAADGSLRDGLSLLDQAIAYGGGKLSDEDVRGMLGTIEQRHVLALLSALAEGNGSALLAAISELFESGRDPAGALDELLRNLHRIAVIQAVSGAPEESSDEDIRRFADTLSPEDVQLFYQIGVNGRRDLYLAPDPRTGLEMTLLRMLAFRPASGTQTASEDGGGRQSAAGSKPTGSPAPGARSNSGVEANSDVAEESAGSREPAQAAPEWEAMLKALSLTGAARELAAHCAWGRRERHSVILRLPQAHAHLRGDRPERRLKEALAEFLGHPVRLRIELCEAALDTPASRRHRRESERQKAAREAVESDETVQALRDRLGAEVLPDSVRPVDP